MNPKPTIKWVKAANAWCKTTYEMDKKKGKLVNRVAWFDEKPSLDDEAGD